MRADPGDGCVIVLVGDDALARSALRGAVEREAALTIVGEGSLADCEALLELEPDVVVWDAGTAAHTSSPPPQAAVPVVLLVEEAGEGRRAFRAGVAGVVQRAADGEVLTAAVLAASRGLRVLDGAFSDAPPAKPREGDGDVEPLTPRELEVLVLLADGLSNRRIAQRLEISEHTVKFHVNALLWKLSADTRTAAVVKAARLGLLHL